MYIYGATDGIPATVHYHTHPSSSSYRSRIVNDPVQLNNGIVRMPRTMRGNHIILRKQFENTLKHQSKQSILIVIPTLAHLRA